MTSDLDVACWFILRLDELGRRGLNSNSTEVEENVADIVVAAKSAAFVVGWN